MRRVALRARCGDQKTAIAQALSVNAHAVIAHDLVLAGVVPVCGTLAVTVTFRAQRRNVEREGSRVRSVLRKDVVRDPVAEFALGCVGIPIG